MYMNFINFGGFRMTVVSDDEQLKTLYLPATWVNAISVSNNLLIYKTASISIFAEIKIKQMENRRVRVRFAPSPNRSFTHGWG